MKSSQTYRLNLFTINIHMDFCFRPLVWMIHSTCHSVFGLHQLHQIWKYLAFYPSDLSGSTQKVYHLFIFCRKPSDIRQKPRF